MNISFDFNIRQYIPLGVGETPNSRINDRRRQLREARAAADHAHFLLIVRRSSDIGTQFRPRDFWDVSETNLVDASKSHPTAKRNETYMTRDMNKQMDSDCAVVAHVHPGTLNDLHREFEVDDKGRYNLIPFKYLRTKTKIWVDHLLTERGASKEMHFEPIYVYGNADLRNAWQWPACHWAQSFIRFLQDERNHHVVLSIEGEECEYSM